jgi:hypothetical protein
VGPRRTVGVAAAIALLALIAVVATLPWTPAPPPPAPTPAAPPAAASRAPEVVPREELPDMPEPPPGVELDEDGVPTKDLTIHALGPGDGTGVFAFPPPGTKPIKRGIVVPEGYVLPPGYLRHHQTTDDGEEVPPILVFDPTNPPRDAAGQPMVVPADPVVPPELAPPGMPITLLDPPPVRADLDENAQPLR